MAALSSILSLLLPVLLLAVLLQLPSPSRADITFSEISGKYTKQIGNLGFCMDLAEVDNKNSSRLRHSDMSFGGVAAGAGSVVLTQKTSPVGIVVTGKVGRLFWNGEVYFFDPILALTAIFARPNTDFEYNVPGYVNPYTLKQGVRYYLIFNVEGGCVYRYGYTGPPPEPKFP